MRGWHALRMLGVQNILMHLFAQMQTALLSISNLYNLYNQTIFTIVLTLRASQYQATQINNVLTRRQSVQSNQLLQKTDRYVYTYTLLDEGKKTPETRGFN